MQVMRRAEGKKPRLSSREWSEVLQDLFELRRLIPVVSPTVTCEIFAQNLLASEQAEHLNLVKEIFNCQTSKSSKSSILYVLNVHKIGNLPLESKEKVVGKAVESYIDSSKDVDDPNLELAQKCLDLLEDSQRLQKYHDVLQGN